ncbi:MAG: cob(I)yrinic acid a,c-diamide adenosyltransferase [Proteobacteria bacterium]|nr:cob(I)yrinic acid a,c-diamide adenosyltransferase [Pseudomonadota bacterium]
MPNRLTKIITRSGDKGMTGLANGTRTSKSAPRIDALGEVDELNSAIGLLLCEELPQEIQQALRKIQNDLFDIGGELSLPGRELITEAQLARLEQVAIESNAKLPPLKEFILPGGCRAAALAQLCRTICRRAERSLVQLASVEAVPETGLRYLNRLSDLLFVLGRSLNLAKGEAETYWQKPEK